MYLLFISSHRAGKDADSKAPRPTFQGTGYSVVNINEGSTLDQVGEKQVCVLQTSLLQVLGLVISR